MNTRLLALGALSSLVLLVGCKKSEKELEATKMEWLRTAPACPAPATCTGKVTAMTREVKICAPADPSATYAAGDLVVVHEPTTINTVAKLKEAKGAGWNVEFPDGYVLERKKEAILGRMCN